MQTVDTNTASQMEPATTGTHRRRRSRSGYRYQAKIRRYQYLLVGISILFLILYILTWNHFASKSGERERAIRELRKLEVTHEAATTELEQVRSERDTLVPASVAEDLRALPAAGKVEVIKGAAHALFISRAEATAAAIREFLTDMEQQP